MNINIRVFPQRSQSGETKNNFHTSPSSKTRKRNNLLSPKRICDNLLPFLRSRTQYSGHLSAYVHTAAPREDQRRRPEETTLPIQVRSGRSHSSCCKYMSGLLTDIVVIIIVPGVVEAQTVPLEGSLCTLCGRLLASFLWLDDVAGQPRHAKISHASPADVFVVGLSGRIYQVLRFKEFMLGFCLVLLIEQINKYPKNGFQFEVKRRPYGTYLN